MWLEAVDVLMLLFTLVDDEDTDEEAAEEDELVWVLEKLVDRLGLISLAFGRIRIPFVHGITL